MNNKGPVLIAYLSQIILVIILLQVSGALKWLTIIITLVTELLIGIALIKERRWSFQAWYAFFIFFIMLIFLITHILPGISDVTTQLSVELIIALILGLFITTFSRKEPAEETMQVNVVDMEPKIEKVFTEKVTTKKPVKTEEKKRAIYVFKTGGKAYHKRNCWTLKRTPKKDLQPLTSKQQAAGKGLKACKVCIK